MQALAELRHRGTEAGSRLVVAPGPTPPESQPSSEVQIASEGAKLAQLEKLRVRSEADAAEAQAKLAKIQSQIEPPSQDPIDKALERLVKLKSLEVLQGKPADGSHDDGLERALRVLSIAKELVGNNGKSSNDDLFKLLLSQTLNRSDADTLAKFASLGLVKAPDGSPISELAARVELAKMQLRAAEAREARAELRQEKKDVAEGQTLSKLVDLGGKAVDAIAKPISDGISMNIKSRGWLPGDARPATPPAPGASVMTPQEQLGRLRQIREQAATAEEKILEQLRAQGAPAEVAPTDETAIVPVPQEPLYHSTDPAPPGVDTLDIGSPRKSKE